MKIDEKERQTLLVALDCLMVRLMEEALTALHEGRQDILRMVSVEALALRTLHRRLEAEQPAAPEDTPAPPEVYRETLSSIARAQAAAREASAKSDVPQRLRKPEGGGHG